MEFLSRLILFCLLSEKGFVEGTERESLDVLEGEEVTLQCRFDPVAGRTELTLYWIRNNRDGSDNAAIGSTSLDSNYRVEKYPELGRYDLKIENTTYDRDNGNFKCMVKQGGTGVLLHIKKISLTVLLKPSPPRVTPSTPVSTEGTPVNLTCSSVGGSPPPQLRWYREGDSQLLESTMILGSTREDPSLSILTILPQKEDNGAVFRCTVWNRALGQRQKLEHKTTLQVNYFPRVSIGPENPLRVEEGDTAVLMCQVDARPEVENVKWTREGRYIATTFRHVIPTVDRRDEGPYFCEADNQLGQTGKGELNLIVLHEPKISLERFKEVNAGEEVRIHCKVTANPHPVSFKWRRHDTPGFEQEGEYLNIRDISPQDSGVYSCSATNVIDPSGENTRRRTGNGSIELAVRHKPGVGFVQPSRPAGIEGKSITLTCGANPSGFPEPKFTWWKEGNPTQVLSTEASLTIRPIRMDSGGNYICKPYNELGDGTPVTWELNVEQEPRIVSGLQERILRKVGDTGLIMTCSGIGKPKPDVTWFKDGAPIDPSDSRMFSVTVSAQQSYPQTTTNVISSIRFTGSAREATDGILPSDAGEYVCQFENNVGRAQSAVVLKVEHKPLVSHKHNKIAADPGEMAEIPCRMKAFPAPSFQWEWQNSAARSKVGFYEIPMRQIGDNEYESILRVSNVNPSFYGEFVCKAGNNMGSVQTVVNLVKKGRPESPSNLESTDTGPNSIVMSWVENFNGGLNNTMFKLQYRELGGSISDAKEIGCRTKECKLSDLKQHTTYIVRSKAINPLGESNWSEQVSITTQIDVSQIPRAESLYFEISTKSISFKVNTYPLNLMGKIEVMTEEQSWTHLRSVSLKHHPYKFAVNSDIEFQNVRIRLCLESNDMLCGAYTEASVVDRIQEQALFSVDGESWLVAVIVGVLVTAVISLIVLAKFCHQRRSKNSSLLKKEDISVSKPDLLHTSLSYDKITALSKEVDGIPDNNLQRKIGENSSGGVGDSVNSQDSLWNVPGDEYRFKPSLDQMDRFDADYAHYPQPEEYLADLTTKYLTDPNGFNLVQPKGLQQDPKRFQGDSSFNGFDHGQYFANGDQYAVPAKLRSNIQGLPLNGTLNREKNYYAHSDQSSQDTPKKVIREIIV